MTLACKKKYRNLVFCLGQFTFYYIYWILSKALRYKATRNVDIADRYAVLNCVQKIWDTGILHGLFENFTLIPLRCTDFTLSFRGFCADFLGFFQPHAVQQGFHNTRYSQEPQTSQLMVFMCPFSSEEIIDFFYVYERMDGLFILEYL